MSDARTALRLGTRASALAIAQAGWVASALESRRPDLRVELVRIRTRGDRVQNRSLAAIGGKGLFVEEIEDALIDGRIDCAVHSMKDLPATLARGLGIAAVPKRENPQDALIARGARAIGDLSRGARIGTGSLRRQAFLKRLRPDLEIVGLRGNVDTRIAKWRAGEIDAIVLACAGLARLGLTIPEAASIPLGEMLPAIGQGALAVESRQGGAWWSTLALLDDPETSAAVRAERAFLVALGGDCTTPVAAHARIEAGEVRIAGAIGDPQGVEMLVAERVGAKDDGQALGASVAAELLARGGRRILDGLAR